MRTEEGEVCNKQREEEELEGEKKRKNAYFLMKLVCLKRLSSERKGVSKVWNVWQVE